MMSSETSKKNSPPERYKIKVSGLPRFYALADPLLQEFLKCIRHELKLNCVYARFVRKGNAWLYLTFPTKEEQQKAFAALKRYTWKGRTLVSMLVTSDVFKRSSASSDNEGTSHDSLKKQKIEMQIAEQVLMSTIPYHSLPYSEQLKQKNEEAYSLFCRLYEILMKRSPQLSYWCTERINRLQCPIPFLVDKIRPSPVIDGYRNKYEFSVGINPDTEAVAVGIRVQDRRDGIHHVGPCEGLRHLPQPMISLVKCFERFVIAQGPDWDLWYHLILRMNTKGELMVTLSTNPNKKEIARAKIDILHKGAIECFTNVPENVVSIYFQIHGEKPLSDTTVGIPGKSDLIWGRDHIKENLLNLQLELTPITYFRINSAAAQVLCQVVAELANVDKDTTLLDLFCGSGSLALTLAPYCKEVIGVELIEWNIQDAVKYARINNITNCEFIAGKIEDIIQPILCRLVNKKVIVILDPPRTGIDPILIKTLRQFKPAIRFIYVCSNHKLPLKNLLDLSSINKQTEYLDPIIPVRIIPIDMTPHTLRSELVILCERFDIHKLLKDYKLYSRRDNPALLNQYRQPMPQQEHSPIRPPVATNSAASPSPLIHALNQPGPSQHFSVGPSPANILFPPRPPPPLLPSSATTGFSVPPSLDTYLPEDRYSTFRRDFENAIDSSYSTLSPMGEDLLPLDVVRKIEERAYCEGLTRGIQRSAYEVGYQAGLRKSSEKLQNCAPGQVGPFIRTEPTWNQQSSHLNGFAPPPLVDPQVNWTPDPLPPVQPFAPPNVVNWNHPPPPPSGTVNNVPKQNNFWKPI